MAISLHTLQPKEGAQKTKRRNGRGLGRKGTTGGRGQKGQTSRSGVGGLQRLGMRKLILATPKLRGFRSMHADKQAAVVNIRDLGRAYISGEKVSPVTLLNKGLITSKKYGAKILGAGELTIAVTVKGCEVSKSAAEKITAAGGKVE